MMLTNKINIEVTTAVKTTDISIEVVIISFDFLDFGRYFMMLSLNPNKENMLIKFTTEINAVAIPTFSGEEKLATIIQNTNPSTFRNMAFMF